MPKVAEPPGPADRETSARLRFEELRALTQAAGKPHPGLAEATAEFGRARAERIHAEMPQHIKDRAAESVAKMIHGLPHTVMGRPTAKGRQATYQLNTLQFEQLQETGAWEGDPQLHPRDV